MLKNIRLHIDKDEQKQARLDDKLARHILATHSSNINTFQRNIPSLLPYVQTPDLANYSIFINKYGEHNIVDYGLGRTLYGFHPEKEVLEQISLYQQHCPKIVFNRPLASLNLENSTVTSIDDLESVRRRKLQQPMPYEIECLVVLGCGLGIHIMHLLKQHKIKNLVIYEPELQYFECSVMAISWQKIFALAKEHDTAIFLQLEKDGRDLIQDINELIEHCAIASFHLYKHYNHQVFDSLHKDLSERSWSEIEDSGFKLKSKESYLDFLPNWTPNIDLATHSLLSPAEQKLTLNLNALKKYFPDIYNEFKDYKPKKWQPIANADGEVNLVKIDSLHSWYAESPKQDCTLNFENFNEQPNKDGLVLGYKGTKLAHYIHYQFVKETEELLKQAEEEVGALPDNVPSIIMFGLGVGYQLEKLLAEHTVEKLFICEPNPDFFYASLFAIDWQTVFETVEKSDTRIYLNIGDDGTNLFRDLLSQFYAIGPYILNSTYFYQSYYNASLNSAINQLREQLQVVISMGEYFDHAYYGIAHTKEGMRRKIPILTASPASKLSYEDKEVPVFIVGNGPSLDNSIDAIKEWQGKAIVVSCGTTLQALHRHGITPDFHAEIEQNRSTYDWAILIGDLDYLKKITLISCNGIHPDTCDLYKDVLIAFKEGESSTVSALNVLGREHFTTLLNAFPTVSNFAIDLFSTIGFTSIYLIGVDLGFVDVKHHHSKSSGYYEDNGEETYDFTKSANTSLIVPGNFRPTVNTKHEFKVSRQVIEQVTVAKPKEQEFYNCSDGARIKGSLPIRLDALLIVVTEQQKVQIVEKLKTTIFSTNELENYIEKFESQFSHNLLLEELENFETLLEQEITSAKDINAIINKQKEMLFSSYKNGHSLLFYYMYGTVNYANAVLTKLSASVNTDYKSKAVRTNGLAEWKATLKILKEFIALSKDCDYFETSGFKIWTRERRVLPSKVAGTSLLAVSEDAVFRRCISWRAKHQFKFVSQIQTGKTTDNINNSDVFDFVIYFDDKKLTYNREFIGSRNTMIITHSEDVTIIANQPYCYFSIPKLDDDSILHNLASITNMAIRACITVSGNAFIVPKILCCDTASFNDDIAYRVPTGFVILDFHHFLYICHTSKADLVSSVTGTRGRIMIGNVKKKHLVLNVVSKTELENYKQQHDEIMS